MYLKCAELGHIFNASFLLCEEAKLCMLLNCAYVSTFIYSLRRMLQVNVGEDNQRAACKLWI